MEEQIIAWGLVIVGFLLPLAHVVFTPNAGTWRAPLDSRCPFGPRMGWVIMIVLMGPVGWIMFIASRRRIKSDKIDNIQS